MQRRGRRWLDAAKGPSQRNARGLLQPWVTHRNPASMISKTDATRLTYLHVSPTSPSTSRCKQDGKDLLSYLLSLQFGLSATTFLRARGQSHCANMVCVRLRPRTVLAIYIKKCMYDNNNVVSPGQVKNCTGLQRIAHSG